MPTKSNFVDLWQKGSKLLELQTSHWSLSGTAVMIKVTCPPATAVNQLNTSYIIDILVITFPKAHLWKNIFYFNYEQSEASPYPKRITKFLLMQVYKKQSAFPSTWTLVTAQSLSARMLSRWPHQRHTLPSSEHTPMCSPLSSRLTWFTFTGLYKKKHTHTYIKL